MTGTADRPGVDAGSRWALPGRGDVRMIENVFIPMLDGVKLAVQLWLPADADRHPAPVVVEYIPYRKRDRYRAYGLYWGRILAQYGIAFARLDTRGSGDSTGLLEDEYLPRHHLDAAAAIAWLAARNWCNGAVGMRGVSWGGFSALQTAALAPPALRAIMPMCASDMRFTDDAHYIGGAFALTGLKWATSMKMVMAAPPDPLISGEAWQQEWRRRLAATPAIAARWLSHQTNDAYWRQGSVGLDWDAIRCPVYVVGGLADSYGEAIPRLLASLKGPRKGLYGPWRHGYPSPAAPGPALDWAWEEVRWWRCWLMGEETGIMREPMLRVYMPDATAAQVAPGPVPGRWTAETAWPSPNVRRRALHLAGGVLWDAPQPSPGILSLPADGVVGLGKVEWVPFAPTELPREQSADDARSAVFDSPPLSETLEMLGAAVLRLKASSDRPVAQLAVRLCEVTAAGESWLVAWGVLNLTHRDGHAHPAPLELGRSYDVEVPLNFTAHRFQAGGRIRVALSPGLWPLIWPAPRIATLTVDLAGAVLDLPVRAPPPVEADMPIPQAPAARDDPETWPRLGVSEADGAVRVTEAWPSSRHEVADIGVVLTGSGPDIDLSMTSGDPLSCVWRAEQSAGYHREGWDVMVHATVSLSASAESFSVEERTQARLNGETVADMRHSTNLPRHLA